MPTTAEVQASITAVVKVVNDMFTYASGDFTTESTALKGTYQDDYAFIADIQSALDGTRDTLSSTISTVSAIIEPLISEYARLADATEGPIPHKASWAQTGFDEIWARLYRFAAEQTTPLTVESRAFTWTEPTHYIGADDSEATDGRAMVQLYRDSYDYDIETATAEDIEGRCVIDVNRGASVQQETFELSGEAAPLDNTVQGGSGLITSITGLSCSDSTAFISNPSFTSYTGSKTSVDGVSGWTMVGDPGVFTNVNIDTTTTYRTFSGEGDEPASLKFIGDDGVKQVWADTNLSFDAATPYYVHVAHYHPAGTEGTIKLTWGGVSVTTTLDGDNKAQWNLTRIGASEATQKNCWLRQFDINDAEIKIEVTGVDPTSSSEYVLVDDVTIGPMTQYGGAQWYALVGGSTPFLDGDYLGGSASAATPWDAVTGGTSGINQRWFAELFGAYLPSTTGDPEWDEPT